MNSKSILVRDYMALAPVFVYEGSSPFSILETMKKFEVESIPVVKEDFSIVGFISKSKVLKALNSSPSKSERTSTHTEQYDSPIVLYPSMTIQDAYSIMKFFNVDGLPVADLPWEKKIIGFLWLDNIMPVIQKNYLKISV